MTERVFWDGLRYEACGRSILRSISRSILVNSSQFWSFLDITSWKPHGNLMETLIFSIKQLKTQSNGRVKPNILVKPAWDVLRAGLTPVFYTPRFSYGVPKTVICTCSR